MQQYVLQGDQDAQFSLGIVNKLGQARQRTLKMYINRLGDSHIPYS
jgi:hypothetical protein